MRVVAILSEYGDFVISVNTACVGRQPVDIHVVSVQLRRPAKKKALKDYSLWNGLSVTKINTLLLLASTKKPRTKTRAILRFTRPSEMVAGKVSEYATPSQSELLTRADANEYRLRARYLCFSVGNYLCKFRFVNTGSIPVACYTALKSFLCGMVLVLSRFNN